MAWQFPPHIDEYGTGHYPKIDAINWEEIKEYYEAGGERLAALSGEPGPRWAFHYDTFHITSIVDNGDGSYTLTDSGKTTDPNWTDTSGWPVSPDRWVSWGHPTGPEWAASDYDCVIDAPCESAGPDPIKVIQLPITGNTADTLTITGLAEKITERTCSTLSELVGRKCTIIKRNGVNWTRGFPYWPNSVLYSSGTITDSGTGTLTTASGFRNLPLVGYDVLYRDGSNVLQRGRITSASNGVLVYTGTTGNAVSDASFYIVAADGYFQWNRKGGIIKAFYGGATEGYLGHSPHDDSIQTVGMPQISGTFNLGKVLGFCEDETVVLYDADFWFDEDEVCNGRSDEPYNPDIFRTLRGLWNLYMQTAVFFGSPVEGADSTPVWTVATWFDALGINSQSATCGTFDVDHGMPVTLSVPYTPIDCWFTSQDSKGETIEQGTGTYDGTYLSNLTDSSSGKALVISLGPDRIVPRRFCSIYDTSYFLPDSVDGASVIPPTNDNPGQWIKRAKSTHYLAADKYGFVNESSLSVDLFQDQDLGRYVGTNFYDPGLIPNTTSDSTSPDTTYHDYAHVSTRAPATQRRIDGSKSGKATSGSNQHLTDSTKDWLSVDFYPATNSLTHTGTGGSGSSTTQLVDASRAGTGLWAASRYADGALVGFTIEFLITGSSFTDPAAVIEKRLITSGDGTTGTLIWDEALSVSCESLDYQIIEPFVRNRWKDRKLKIKQGTDSAEVTILGNCSDTLFFSDIGFAIDNTASYTIIEPKTGCVMRYDGDLEEWTNTSPTETDTRSPNPQFQANPNNNLEDHVTRYGLPLPMDVTPHFLVFWTQLYDSINIQQNTRHSVTWTNDPGSGPENNEKHTPGTGAGNSEDWPQGGWTKDNVDGNYSTNFCELQYLTNGNTFPTDEASWNHLFSVAIAGLPCDSIDPSVDGSGCPIDQAPYSYAAGGYCSDGYAGATATADDGQAPYCRAHGELTGQGGQAIGEKVYSYPKANIPQCDCPFTRDVSFWVYCEIDPDAHDAGTYCVELDPIGNPGVFSWSFYTFDDNGDSVLYRKWHQFNTVSGTEDKIVIGGPLGLDELVTPPNTPAWQAPTGSCSDCRDKIGFQGYTVTAAWAWSHWNFNYI